MLGAESTDSASRTETKTERNERDQESTFAASLLDAPLARDVLEAACSHKASLRHAAT